MSVLQKIKKLTGLLPCLITNLGIVDTFRFLILRRRSHDKNKIIHSFSPKRLKGQTIEIRTGTTDVGSFQDFLTTRFYLPPWELPDDCVIIDLGGNIGTAAADYSATFPDARILSIEMDGENAKMARANTSKFNDRVNVIHAAIWHENGTVKYDGIGEDGFHIGVDSESPHSVRAITMKDLLDQEGIEKVDFLKIDIEGAEEQLFSKGSLDWLTQVESLGCEIHGTELYDPIVKTLEAQGFTVERDPRHWSSILARRK